VKRNTPKKEISMRGRGERRHEKGRKRGRERAPKERREM
jgi:hypothetical protein